jgi:hypothetical protein
MPYILPNGNMEGYSGVEYSDGGGMRVGDQPIQCICDLSLSSETTNSHDTTTLWDLPLMTILPCAPFAGHNPTLVHAWLLFSMLRLPCLEDYITTMSQESRDSFDETAALADREAL